MEFNSKLSNYLDEPSPTVRSTAEKESQMDKIKYTLDDLNARINVMRKKFRTYTIKMKRTANNRSNGEISSDNGEFDEEEDFDDDNVDLIKLLVVIQEAGNEIHIIK